MGNYFMDTLKKYCSDYEIDYNTFLNSLIIEANKENSTPDLNNFVILVSIFINSILYLMLKI